jgi:hypothetical protein
MPVSDAPPAYRLSDDAAATQLDDASVVVLHLADQTYFRLNRTGARVWQVLDENDEMTAPEIVDALHASEDDVERDALETDVHAFLDDMLEAGLFVSS